VLSMERKENLCKFRFSAISTTVAGYPQLKDLYYRFGSLMLLTLTSKLKTQIIGYDLSRIPVVRKSEIRKKGGFKFRSSNLTNHCMECRGLIVRQTRLKFFCSKCGHRRYVFVRKVNTLTHIQEKINLYQDLVHPDLLKTL